MSRTEVGHVSRAMQAELRERVSNVKFPLPPTSKRRIACGPVVPFLELTLYDARYVLEESKQFPGLCQFVLRDKGPQSGTLL